MGPPSGFRQSSFHNKLKPKTALNILDDIVQMSIFQERELCGCKLLPHSLNNCKFSDDKVIQNKPVFVEETTFERMWLDSLLKLRYLRYITNAIKYLRINGKKYPVLSRIMIGLIKISLGLLSARDGFLRNKFAF